MKNLLRFCIPFVCALLGLQMSAKAQSCLITSARVSSDTSCVFTTWTDDVVDLVRRGISQTRAISVNGVNYIMNDTATTGLIIRFTRDSTANCDTTGATDLFGNIVYSFFGLIDSCTFQGGKAVADCPDNVLVSQGGNCLVFNYLDPIYVSPPDSVVLNDTVYYSQGYNPSHPTEIIYLNDTTMACDTSNGMQVLLNDTLRFGPKVCTYEDGILPIVVLAFDYKVLSDQVELSWKVNADEPTRRLYLQKSYDGIRWSNVYDQAMAQPYAGVFTTGTYIDGEVNRSKVYYRLFIEGHQDRNNYSSILPVTLSDRQVNTIFYQPQSRSIMIKAGQKFVGQMDLINAHGQSVMSKSVQLNDGGFVEVQVEGVLPSGIYFVRFEDGLIPATRLFIQ